MKDPKRYGHKAIIYPKANDDTYITIPVEDTDGKWIAYDHYARLKAEVERLRKAGDNLARAADENGCHDNGDAKDLDDSIDRWNAAKEGKPSV